MLILWNVSLAGSFTKSSKFIGFFSLVSSFLLIINYGICLSDDLERFLGMALLCIVIGFLSKTLPWYLKAFSTLLGFLYSCIGKNLQWLLAFPVNLWWVWRFNLHVRKTYLSRGDWARWHLKLRLCCDACCRLVSELL